MSDTERLEAITKLLSKPRKPINAYLIFTPKGVFRVENNVAEKIGELSEWLG